MPTGQKVSALIVVAVALLGAVYTVDPFVRTPEEVLDALFHEAPAGEPPPSRPRPCGKYVRAALQRDDQDSTEPQVQTIFSWLAEQVAQREARGRADEAQDDEPRDR